MIVIRCDFETRARAYLGKNAKKNRGLFRYIACPEFRPLILCYEITRDGVTGPIQTWIWGQPCPDDFFEAVVSGADIHAYNSQFEELVFEWLAKHRGWPAIAPERYHDTAAAVAAVALPRALEDAAKVLQVDAQKDKEGKQLIEFFSQPNRKGVFNEPEDHPEKFERFIEYCRQDVRAEKAVAERVPALSAYERRVWLMYGRQARRGIRVDVQACQGAMALAAGEASRMDKMMAVLTLGEVSACTKATAIKDWCNRRWEGYSLAKLDKAAISEALQRDDIPADVKAVLELRKEAGKISVKKLDAMVRRADADGRVRGTTVYHGASTGRTASVVVNFNNMPRPSKTWEKAKLDKIALFRAFQEQDAASIPEWNTGLTGLISDAVRSFVWAAPGHVLLQADFSSIEALVAAWIAGEHWQLELFRKVKSDPKTPDIYRQTGSRMFGLSTDEISKEHPLRQVSKVACLALQYGGGVAAFADFAKLYSVNLSETYELAVANAPEALIVKAERRYARCLRRGEHRADSMTRDAWMASELIKLMWRDANPAIKESWALLEDAMRDAIETSELVTACRVSYKLSHGFLWCRLPSGRLLAYAAPKLRDCVWVKHIDADGMIDEDAVPMDAAEAYQLVALGQAKVESRARPRVTACGVDSMTKQWRRYAITGGLALENNTQAASRDILVDAMLRLEAKGFNPIFDVYDEIVCEQPLAEIGRHQEMIDTMLDLPAWCLDLPLGADGKRFKRYAK